MKKNYLLLLFLLASFSTLFAQVRLVRVEPSTNTVVIQNYGGTTVDISSWWTCHLFAYAQLSNGTVNSGSLNLAPGAQVNVTISSTMNTTASDLGLYNTSSFGSTAAMEDFVQWGSGGNGRENVAVAKGIWDAGTFIAGGVTPPYAYTGNGTTDNGVTFWDSFLSVGESNFEKQVGIFPNPNNGSFKISSSLYPITQIKIFNILGELIYEQDPNQVFSMDMNLKLNAGIYMVELHSNNLKVVKRAIIE